MEIKIKLYQIIALGVVFIASPLVQAQSESYSEALDKTIQQKMDKSLGTVSSVDEKAKRKAPIENAYTYIDKSAALKAQRAKALQRAEKLKSMTPLQRRTFLLAEKNDRIAAAAALRKKAISREKRLANMTPLQRRTFLLAEKNDKAQAAAALRENSIDRKTKLENMTELQRQTFLRAEKNDRAAGLNPINRAIITSTGTQRISDMSLDRQTRELAIRNDRLSIQNSATTEAARRENETDLQRQTRELAERNDAK